ncbi:Uncharacterized protein YfkK, UPF0435 family [Salinibacillus kushneri]|uniref:Uncharacterized protein YfkK, UPF0435 family n=1 Tax=Salinibacillus kushneri TaxID=237682 RepID=A0A1I0HIP6_9BACI|nr:DUF1128 family protein [Salinibacillus kushneri]SET83758.1 Uncharacterized protein YfkK, UPF0435 family [Salinibacillus kushneri]
MSLKEASEQNLSYIIEELMNDLQVINRSVLDPKYFDVKDYHDIKSVYEMVKSKNQLSLPELQAIIEELRKFRVQ